MKKTILLSMLLIMPGLIWQCATVGPGGETGLVLISTKQEIEIGKGVDQNIRKEFRMSRDASLEEYVKNVGVKVAAVCDRKDLTYSFAVLETNMINAFAAPGGYIYVTTGILKFLENEAQLAGVLGHEIGHVVGRHSVRALQKTYAMQYGIQVLVGQMSSEQLAQMVGLASTVGATMVLQGYSRANEYDADHMGTLYSYNAGYNPYEMETFMGKLDNLGGGKSPSGLEKLFASHPPSAERKKKIKERADTMASASERSVNREEFKKRTSHLK